MTLVPVLLILEDTQKTRFIVRLRIFFYRLPSHRFFAECAPTTVCVSCVLIRVVREISDDTLTPLLAVCLHKYPGGV